MANPRTEKRFKPRRLSFDLHGGVWITRCLQRVFDGWRERERQAGGWERSRFPTANAGGLLCHRKNPWRAVAMRCPFETILEDPPREQPSAKPFEVDMKSGIGNPRGRASSTFHLICDRLDFADDRHIRRIRCREARSCMFPAGVFQGLFQRDSALGDRAAMGFFRCKQPPAFAVGIVDLSTTGLAARVSHRPKPACNIA